MKKRELEKILVINRLIDGYITTNDAASLLGSSARQVKRLKKGVMQEGPKAVIHKNRGRPPANAIPLNIKQKVIELASSSYQGFNFHHIRDMLECQHNIKISTSSVRRILTSAAIKSSKNRRRKPKIHPLRPCPHTSSKRKNRKTLGDSTG